MTKPSSAPYSSMLTNAKNTIWAKAMVIMMKYTPFVRRQMAPVPRANNALSTTAKGM